MTTTIAIQVDRGSEYYGRVQVGTPDGTGHVLQEVEVYMSQAFGEMTVQINMCAIGSHTPELARVRAANYLKAAEVAEAIMSFFEGGSGIESVSHALTDPQLQADLGLDPLFDPTDGTPNR